MLLPSGRTAFSQDVSFSAWGSREQQDVGSENPESEVRVVESEVWEVERESESPDRRAEAWGFSTWDSGSREWLSSSRSPAPTVLLSPMASSPVPRPLGEPAGIRGRSTRHWDVSGDVLPDWKGGWNTLMENLHRETLEWLQYTAFYKWGIPSSDLNHAYTSRCDMQLCSLIICYLASNKCQVSWWQPSKEFPSFPGHKSS